MQNSPRRFRQERAAAVREFARAQDDVVTFPQMYRIGLSRSEVRAELRAQRWSRSGSQSVVVHNGPLQPRSRLWVALFNAGADAALDGVSALHAAGLQNFDSDVIHLSVSKRARYRRAPGVRVHETRRRQPGDLVAVGLPRVKPGIAAVRAALWAVSDRQAALLVSMVVQQGSRRCTMSSPPCQRFAATDAARFLLRIIGDIASAAQSMGELDFLAECRRRGLPSPSHQVSRRLPSGRVYLDAYWEEFGVVVEIEGAQHLVAGLAVADSLRQNELTIDHDRVLRIPVLGLHVAPGRVLRPDRQVAAQTGVAAIHLLTSCWVTAVAAIQLPTSCWVTAVAAHVQDVNVGRTVVGSLRAHRRAQQGAQQSAMFAGV